MAIPEKIKVRREENYVTHNIGKRENCEQFMAFVTATLPIPPPKDWQKHKRWYGVLHRFNADGHHLSTDAWCGGTTADGEQHAISRAEAKLNEWLNQLQPYQLGDVMVRPFSVEIDGQRFGLIAGYYNEDSAELLPNGLGFHEPWDGTYDT